MDETKLAPPVPLVGEPKVLLLDEPGVGVDPISRRELWQMVHELAGEGMLILWSTSYLDEAEQCRDVLLMNEGELLYQGGQRPDTNHGRTQLSDDQSTRGQPQTVATRLETAAGQRRHDSGEIGTSDPQKETTPDDIRPCRQDAGNQHQRNYATF